jgi:hypothetical protein
MHLFSAIKSLHTHTHTHTHTFEKDQTLNILQQHTRKTWEVSPGLPVMTGYTDIPTIKSASQLNQRVFLDTRIYEP